MPEVSDRNVRYVGADRVVSWVDDPDSGVSLLDVRIASAYAEGHLPEARNVPLPDLRAGHPAVAGAGVVVVYGAGFNDPLTAAATKKLLAAGVENVFALRGGVQAWTEAGRPLTTTPPPASLPSP